MSKPIPVVGEFVPPIVDGGMLHVAKATVGSVGSTGNDVDLGAEAATTPLFAVKAGTIVYDMLAKVVTAFTASVAMTIGDSDSVAGWFPDAALGATTISSEFKSAKNVPSTAITDLNAYGAGKLYSADQTIDIVTGASTIVGQMDVYLVYSRVG